MNDKNISFPTLKRLSLSNISLEVSNQKETIDEIFNLNYIDIPGYSKAVYETFIQIFERSPKNQIITPDDKKRFKEKTRFHEHLRYP